MSSISFSSSSSNDQTLSVPISPSQENRIKAINANSELECYLPPGLPLALQQLIYRLAFSTLSNVQLTATQKMQGEHWRFISSDDPYSKEKSELIEAQGAAEMHNAYTVLTRLSPRLADTALERNIPIIRNNLINKIANNLFEVCCDEKTTNPECYIRLRLIKTLPMTTPLSDQLKQLANCTCCTTIPFACTSLIHKIPLDTAKFLIPFGDKNHLLEHLIRIDYTQLHNSVEILNLVIQQGANVHHRFLDPAHQWHKMPLQQVWNHHAAQCLLENGADTEAIDKEGNTALHYAAGTSAFRDLSQIAHVLCEFGANVNARNIRGDTPIFIAIASYNWHCADYLIDRGAQLSISDYAGTTLDSIAKLYGKQHLEKQLKGKQAIIIKVMKKIEEAAKKEAAQVPKSSCEIQ